jgi:hypothetical protein
LPTDLPSSGHPSSLFGRSDAMSVCETCNREMLVADGCIEAPFKLDDKTTFLRIRHGEEKRHGSGFGARMPAQMRCHDCNAKKGQFHHPGCDMEECPKCHGQAICCGCFPEELWG